MTELEATLQAARHAGLLRELRVIDTPPAPHVQIDGRDVLLLCSNDYLGLAGSRRLRQAAADAALTWGAGAGSSRLVAGSLALHHELEAELARLKRTEACVLFGSGFLANTGTVAALAGRGGIVFSDALNHASLIDGCRLAGAETVIYPHADVDALRQGLRRAGNRPATIVTDSIFSMDGDAAPLSEIAELAEQHHARLVVDEAHATGVVGPHGRGLVAELDLVEQVDVTIGTLSKALGGYGAFACCSSAMASYLVNHARTLIFSTALPPPSVGAALEAVRIVDEHPELIDRLRTNARVLRVALAERGFDVPPGEMPIIPLVIGDPAEAISVCEMALDAGVFAQAIRPPTVPEGTSRLRLTVMATHDPDDLRIAADVLAEAASRGASSGRRAGRSRPPRSASRMAEVPAWSAGLTRPAPVARIPAARAIMDR